MAKSMEIKEEMAKITANLNESTRKLKEKAQNSRESKKIQEKMTGIKKNLKQSRGQLTENVQTMKRNLPRSHSDYLEFYGYIRVLPVLIPFIGLLLYGCINMNMTFRDEKWYIFILTGLQLHLMCKLFFDETKRGHLFGWTLVATFNSLIILILWKSVHPLDINFFICPTTCLCLDAIMLLFSIIYGICSKLRGNTESEEFWLYDEIEEIP